MAAAICHTRGLRFKRISRRLAIACNRVDDAVLALLYLGWHDEDRTWKGFDWGALDRLHEKGMISKPAGKAKSVQFSPEGLRRSRELFEALFGTRAGPG